MIRLQVPVPRAVQYGPKTEILDMAEQNVQPCPPCRREPWRGWWQPLAGPLVAQEPSSPFKYGRGPSFRLRVGGG